MGDICKPYSQDSGLIAETQQEVKMVTVGRKGRDFFRRGKMEFLD